MDYKKLISSKKLRLKILKLVEFIPDKVMIFIQYKVSTGKWLNIDVPKRFTEKLQWYKLNYRDPLMTVASDKFAVRKYVAEKGLENILIPLYGVYKSFEDIDFSKLPKKFVLKTTNGSHTNILCENLDNLDLSVVKSNIDKWLKERSNKLGREWSYYNITPKVICEKFLNRDTNNDLIDYKFFCFNGEPFCLYVIVERFLDDGLKLGIYDMNFKRMPYRRSDIQKLESDVVKPKNFEKMIEIAKVLSKDFPHVRVDLYNIDGEIFFGELTFYDGCGYKGFLPDEFDFILGEKFQLPLSHC